MILGRKAIPRSVQVVTTLLLAMAAMVISPLPVSGYGIIVPVPPRPFPRPAEPVRLGEGEVQVQLSQHLAKTTIRQTFLNPHDRDQEADFLFPVPPKAQVTGLSLMIHGRMVASETLPKAQARDIYESIVREARDPALLEWAENDLYRLRVFPIPARGKQVVEMTFEQPLETDLGLIRYRLPIRRATSTDLAASVEQAMPVEVVAETSAPLRLLQSPTHGGQFQRLSGTKARLSFPADALHRSSFRHLEVHLQADDSPLSLSLIEYQPQPSQPGYFALRIVPAAFDVPQNATTGSLLGQNYVFIMDTSGSMADTTDKIGQAKRALKACLRMLQPHDTFAIVRFSSDASSFDRKLRPASLDHITQALQWVDDLTARGGTHMSAGLELAIDLLKDAPTSASSHILFFTDGIANIGLTRPEDLVRLATQAPTAARIFAFGLGYDVQAPMLDQIAEQTGGTSDYIRPEEDLELPVSRLFEKIAQPALQHVKVFGDGLEILDLTPTPIPDIFHGTERLILGRFQNRQNSDVRYEVRAHHGESSLSATISGAQTVSSQRELAYVQTLWAMRKLANLMDQYRRSSDSPAELRTEIEDHCRRHGLLSPFTSLLVTEDGAPRSVAAPGRSMSTHRPPSRTFSASTHDSRAASGSSAELPATLVAKPASSGRLSVEQSLAVKTLRESSVALAPTNQPLLTSDLRTVAGRRFRALPHSSGDSIWVEESLLTKGAPDKIPASEEIIHFLSPAWFELGRHAFFLEVLALGERVIFDLGGVTVEIRSSSQPSDQKLPSRLRERLDPN